MKTIKRAVFRVLRSLIKLCYPKTHILGAENLPDEPCIIVGNHSQIHGPLVSEFYIPGKHYTWCNAQMTVLKEVPAYAYADFWAQKPRYIRWLYKIISYLIAPLSVFIFSHVDIIPVYHNNQVIHTYRDSVKRLTEGNRLVIFPEHAKPHNCIVYDFQKGFVDVAKMYHRHTGKVLQFVPMYIAPQLRKAYIGTPLRYNPDEPAKQERERVCGYLAEEITRMATELPRHKVVPYVNLPRHAYHDNKEETI